MSVAHNAQHEFWRPPAIADAHSASGDFAQACENCGTEFMVGSRFCHVCGTGRQPLPANAVPQSWTSYLEFHSIKRGVGLSTPSLVAFIIGLACVIGALATGVIYSERNLVEWQAVQLFRMQWLLAGLAAFVAGILLKKSNWK
jgi:hypothetical protein